MVHNLIVIDLNFIRGALIKMLNEIMYYYVREWWRVRILRSCFVNSKLRQRAGRDSLTTNQELGHRLLTEENFLGNPYHRFPFRAALADSLLGILAFTTQMLF